MRANVNASKVHFFMEGRNAAAEVSFFDVDARVQENP
jgi:hypothetical protein